MLWILGLKKILFINYDCISHLLTIPGKNQISERTEQFETNIGIKAPFKRAIFVWQFLCDEFYLLVYMSTFARILCGKYICRKTSLPVFMWQTKIVNYEYLFVYMTRHIFVACIYLHVCQALCDYSIALKTNFCVESKHICCIIYTSNRICHGKLSNKNCSCKRGF